MFHYRRVLGAIMLAAPILIKGAIFISDVSVADGVRLLARLYSGTKLSRAAWEILWHGMIVVGARPRLWGGVIAILVLW